ncbi:adenylate/guanylate cyclase domain-containing protein [Sulfuritalea sp.]|uniref:adenylate/guanylate cyclase domain-containing protein n=1 Tax=Sulfuritalea sp. TaxID=2480090 RepID=UPI001AD56DB5|nr:adenylate/guanylate cyclase domain-containing protein [Sulfuritalea sp.]MBN8474970.1 adenylate/guanylate cyclase domain-containing protein [Sulfuritalea sp.]
MITYETGSTPQRFLARLQNAGIEPGDSEELRLNKSLLMLATGFASVAIMIWVAIYLTLGPQFSTTAPLVFQLLLAGNMLLFIRTRNFDFFRVTQLGLFLFLPFVAQWSGTIISTSGVLLWALLGPIGALLCIGVRQSVGWFIAWVVLTALSGAADWYLADTVFGKKSNVPVRTTIVFFALNFIAISTIIYLLLRRSIAERRKTLDSLELAHKQIQIEQERSEKLLLNILPGSIADRLKTSDKTIADGFADVTVMFADIVNFTQVAANMSPSQVFAMLNRIFSAFDELAEQYGLEKIKTIGDAYMVAGGLDDNVTNYSAAIADMALAMRDLLRRDFAINSSHLEVRIGIGTGPIVAGVLGKKKFIYDLWGDTVNIASRITSEGVPGMIQCDTMTYHRLASSFDFHEPQTIYLKGKGNMTVYRLVGRKGAVAEDSAPWA